MGQQARRRGTDELLPPISLDTGGDAGHPSGRTAYRIRRLLGLQRCLASSPRLGNHRDSACVRFLLVVAEPSKGPLGGRPTAGTRPGEAKGADRVLALAVRARQIRQRVRRPIVTLRWRVDGEDYILESSVPVIGRRGPRIGRTGVEDGLLRRRTRPWREVAALTWDLGGGGNATLAVCIFGNPWVKELSSPATALSRMGRVARAAGASSSLRRGNGLSGREP